jgi:hypothetical protein
MDYDMIDSYTRAQAIEDGVLVDVGTIAQEIGYRVPIAITAELWGMISTLPEGSPDSLDGRLWDLLFLGMSAIRRASSKNYDASSKNYDASSKNYDASSKSQEILYKFFLDEGNVRNNIVAVKMHIGSGDNGEPAITIMLPHED